MINKRSLALIGSLRRHLSFLNKLKAEPLDLMDHGFNDIVYKYKIDNEFFRDDLCNAQHLLTCKAKCCRDISKGICLIYSERDFQDLPKRFKNSFESVFITVNKERKMFYYLYVKNVCPFLKKNGKCEIHKWKPLMCEIPMIHFDLKEGVVHVTKRLYGCGFEKSCVMKLEPFKDKINMIRNYVKDSNVLIKMGQEFDWLGVKHNIWKILDSIVNRYVKLVIKKGGI